MADNNDNQVALDPFKHHDPHRNNPFYYKGFWGAFKGHTKGVFGGIIVGTLLGGLAGAALGGLIFATGLVAVPVAVGSIGAAVATCSLLFAAAGLSLGSHIFGEAGNVAGSGAAMHHIAEARNLTGAAMMISEATGKPVTIPSPSQIDAIVSPVAPMAHNTESPHFLSATSYTSRWFYPKVGAIGMTVGLGVGALLAGAAVMSGTLPIIAGALGTSSIAHFVLGAEAAHIVATIGAPAFIGICSAMSGVVGLTFGIERNRFRSVFDITDRLFAGNYLNNHEKTPDSPSVTITQEAGKNTVVTAMPAQSVDTAPVLKTHEIPSSLYAVAGNSDVRGNSSYTANLARPASHAARAEESKPDQTRTL